MPTPEQLAYDVRQTAHILGKSEGAIRTMILRKTIPVVKLGRSVLITRETIAALLKGQCFK